QRGTGYSTPRLGCPEYSSLLYDILDENLPQSERLRLVVDAFRTCRDRLSNSGIDLTAYNSAASAADLEDLRTVLGYESWNLYGISYGTRLALTTMRDFPAGIRSVIIDSVYPPQVNGMADAAANAARALDVLFTACAEDATCASAYPNLKAAFYQTVERLNQEPGIVTITHPRYDRRYDVLVDGNLLVRVIFGMLYSQQWLPDLPQVIANVAEGNYVLMGNVLASILYDEEGLSLGMLYSVQCNEEQSFTSLAEYESAVAAYPDLRGFLDEAPNLGQTLFEVCSLWGAGLPDPKENLPVTSSIPTLVMTGQYDPITPPAWGQFTAAFLDHSYFYEYPGLGHGTSVSDMCPMSMAMAFLDDPSRSPDGSCIRDMLQPSFTVVDKSLTLVPFEDEDYGLRGMRPEAWEEYYPGTYVRPGSDEVMLMHHFIEGATASQVSGTIAEQFGLGRLLQPSGTRAANGFQWTLYETEYQSLSYDLALAETRSGTLMILLTSPSNERPDLVRRVFYPAVDALRFG
ncbi:MAG: alpha/beta hydrolase, partial [Anaerolineae bacterium]|nr:alpha/beta hydrolase [Anaerolineae bacterium]